MSWIKERKIVHRETFFYAHTKNTNKTAYTETCKPLHNEKSLYEFTSVMLTKLRAASCALSNTLQEFLKYTSLQGVNAIKNFLNGNVDHEVARFRSELRSAEGPFQVRLV